MARSTLCAGGAKVKTVAQVQYPLSQTCQVLPPGVQMTFSFKRASNQFIILTNSPAKNLKFVITDIWLQAKARTPDPEIFKELVQSFSIPRSIAKYPFLCFGIAGPFQVSTQQTTISQTIFRNKLTSCFQIYKLTVSDGVPPMVAFVYMVTSDRAGGSYGKNLFKLMTPKYKSMK